MSWDSSRHGPSSPKSSIASGMVFTIGFGIAFLVTRPWGWFFIFPLVFAGVLPLINGLLHLPQGRSARSDGQVKRAASGEKQVLEAARDEQGIITPTVVALKTDLSILEADKILEDMARKGYAQMRVTESGRVEYEFPEFQPRLDEDPGRGG